MRTSVHVDVLKTDRSDTNTFPDKKMCSCSDQNLRVSPFPPSKICSARFNHAAVFAIPRMSSLAKGPNLTRLNPFTPWQRLYELVESLRAPEKAEPMLRSRVRSQSDWPGVTLDVTSVRANSFLSRGKPLYDRFVETLARHMPHLKGEKPCNSTRA